MARKSFYELMDKYYADAVRRHQEGRKFLDPGSSFLIPPHA